MLKCKTKEKAAKQVVEDHVDNSGDVVGIGVAVMITMVGIDKYIDKYHDLEEKAKAALIGYVWMDIMQRNLVFGKYNKWELNVQEKKSLLESFNQNGLDRFRVSHVIPLIIEKGLLEDGSVVLLLQMKDAKRDGSHLPELRL